MIPSTNDSSGKVRLDFMKGKLGLNTYPYTKDISCCVGLMHGETHKMVQSYPISSLGETPA